MRTRPTRPCAAIPHWIAAALVGWAAAAGPGATAMADAWPPIAPHPENPRYFSFRGEPAFLITSGEHYGAVLNLDFDYVPYLDELEARGFNLTRLFSGTYREVPGSFNIRENTLAPAPGRYLAPWALARTAAAGQGGERFDLDSWNPEYFRRLEDFLEQASRRRIVVELVLFCPFYEDNLWDANPLNPKNNVNGGPTIPRTEVFTLTHSAMVERHEAFARKVAARLRRFDNLYYEICNEPYFGGVTLAWQARIARAIAAGESGPGARHMIAQNIANGTATIRNPDPSVGLFNFHYATPPAAVRENWPLRKAIGDDETGFRGTADRAYRTEAWAFLIAGGSVFSNLDYSFTAAHEAGDAPVVPPTPGGGGPALRGQLATLKRFLEGFDFLRMAPKPEVVAAVDPAGLAPRVQVLAGPGRAYALYVDGGTRVDLSLEIPAGHYRAEWLNPITGAIDKAELLDHEGGRVRIASPPYVEDIALRLALRSRPKGGFTALPTGGDPGLPPRSDVP